MGLPTGLEQKVAELVKQEEPVTTQETLPSVTQMEPEPAPTTDSPTDEVRKIFSFTACIQIVAHEDHNVISQIAIHFKLQLVGNFMMQKKMNYNILRFKCIK